MHRHLFLMRHGRTYDSDRLIIQGQSDTHLTHAGKLESLAVGQYVAEHHHVHLVISSDLARALETARLVASQIDRPPRVIEVSALREISCGDLEGKPFAELQRYREAHPLGPEHAVPPGGESISELRRRVLNWYNAFLPTATDGTLVVTHKGPLSILIELIAPRMPDREVSLALTPCTPIIVEIGDSGTAPLLEVVRLDRQ